MKLIEADVEPGVIQQPRRRLFFPRQRRRVAVSLAFTLLILVGTVSLVYRIFPERHAYLIARLVEQHTTPATEVLTEPTPRDWELFTFGLLERRAVHPCPATAYGVTQAWSIRVFLRPVAVMRCEFTGGQHGALTVGVMRTRHQLKRNIFREDDGWTARMFHRDGLTWIFVYPVGAKFTPEQPFFEWLSAL